MVSVGSDGIPLLAAVARRLRWARPQVFEHFGTGQVRGDGFILEVVRARAERYDPDSRKPDVSPGTLEEDVWRRDFTINALCQRMDGEVLDVTGRGIDDLRAGILRTPLEPDETFSEDPLRMFRGARFVAQLGFHLAGGVIEAMRRNAQRASILSVERITEELCRLLTSPHPRQGLDVLRESGLLDVVLPEIAAMSGVEQGGFHIYDVFDHVAHAVDAAPPDGITRIAALFHDIGKPATHEIRDGRHTFYDHPQVGARMTRVILTRLRFGNDDIEAICRLVELHLRPIQYDEASFSDAAVRRLIRDAGELRRPLLDLARADTRASSYPDTAGIDALEARMASLDSGGQISRLQSPLGGAEIMALAGNRPPGPWVGAVQRALVDAVLEGEFAAGDSAGARQWLLDHPGVVPA